VASGWGAAIVEYEDPGHAAGDDVAPGTLDSILKQAGLKW
jgi:hypothetical protein